MLTFFSTDHIFLDKTTQINQSRLIYLHVTEESPTFSHEGAFAMVHYLFSNQSIVDHLVVFHAAEAAVFRAVVDLVLHQGTLQERAYPLYGAMWVLTEGQRQ